MQFRTVYKLTCFRNHVSSSNSIIIWLLGPVNRIVIITVQIDNIVVFQVTGFVDSKPVFAVFC